MTKDDVKGDISRDNLLRHKICFQPDDYQIRNGPIQSSPFVLPDHVDAVREGLLVMENIIPKEWERQLNEEFVKFGHDDLGLTWTHQPQHSAFVQEEQHHLDKQMHSAEWEVADKNLECCLEVAKRARKRLEDPEAEWSLFWRTDVFQLFNEEAKMKPEFHSMLDVWSLYESVTWNDFQNMMDSQITQGAQDRTQPKPDLTYAFPTQNLLSSSPKGFARDEFFRTFSLQVLGKLVQQGISCTPTTGLRKWFSAPNTMELSGADKICFPWAVVEMKRHATILAAPIERCYCQAANAAAAALEMQAQLFNKLGKDALSRPPPIIAFTCIGPIVKVWLAYRDEPGPLAQPMKRMVCIWTTSVRLTWGVASLRAIIMNMHTWASRLLKPKLQACVYKVIAGFQTTSQSSSQTSSSWPQFSVSDNPRSSTPERPSLPVNETSILPRAPASCSDIVRTPQGQETPVPKRPQVDTPQQSTPNESQHSPEDILTTKFPMSSYLTTDWAGVFDLKAGPDNVQLHNPTSVLGSSASQCTSRATPNLPIKVPNTLFQTTPTRLPRKGSPSTPQHHGTASDHNSPPSTVKGVGGSGMDSLSAEIRKEASGTIDSQHAHTDLCDLTRAFQSSSLKEGSQWYSSSVEEEVLNSQNITNTNSLFEIANTNISSGHFCGSSTTRTPGIFGRATGGALGQSFLISRPGPKSKTNTAAGSSAQSIINASSLFVTNGTRGLGQYASGSDTNSSSTGGGLLGPSKPANGGFLRRLNTDQSETSDSDSGSDFRPDSDSESVSEDGLYSVVPTEADTTSERDHNSEPDEAYLSGNSSASWTPRGRRPRKR